MKNNILLLSLLFMGAGLSYAQSEIDVARGFALNPQGIRGTHVVAKTYHRGNDEFELIFSYGRIPGLNPASECHTTTGLNFYRYRTKVLIRNLATDAVTELCTLPEGYIVNDVQFVTLNRHKNNNEAVDFCCFCGNQAILTGEYLTIDNHYISSSDTFGFVGFFSMQEALSPQISGSVKLRRVENARTLSHLTAYNEDHGYYYNYVSCSYRQNVVLDVIGTPVDSLNRASNLSRVKFYPERSNTTLWDNNTRLPFYSDEMFTDVTGNKNSVITVSKILHGEDSLLWLRCSDKETQLCFGGRELSDSVWQYSVRHMDFPTYNNPELLAQGVFTLKGSPVLSENRDTNGFVLSFSTSDSASNAIYGNKVIFAGLCNYLLHFENSSDRLTFNDGKILSFSPEVAPVIKDAIYLPAAASHSILAQAWRKNFIIAYSWETTRFYFDSKPITNYNFQSITDNYRATGVDSIHVYGCLQSDTMLAMAKQVYLGNDFTGTCFEVGSNDAGKIESKYTIRNAKARISDRFPDDPIRFPVTEVQFAPINIEYRNICK